ncbi:Uma2 family endonuclease [Kitasatospora sp. NPDC001547]|uniref:Uma2 family endonuclease n=1 Tax=Kitasatospora sp. NPDC001547 TaxID=3364015 RepID=UPI0036B1DC02|nr:Uma2 family endonuclease [Kitasatospora sp. Xyl93]
MSSVVALGQWVLPESPYVLWARGALDEQLGLPEVLRVEVVGGEFVVTPYPPVNHALMLRDIHEWLFRGESRDGGFPWRVVQHVGVDLAEIGDGYSPDLIVVTAEVDLLARAEDRCLSPNEISLVAEVTACPSAHNDRRPVSGKPTKWSGYARTGVPFYLLVDRDPRQPGITLFGEPNRREGTYEVLGEWKFGESVRLPKPFDVKIDTVAWKPWNA